MPAPRLRSLFRKILFAIALIALLAVDSASAQQNPASAAASPKYDLQNEAKFKGTVEQVKLPPKGSEKDTIYLLVKTGADMLDVYLCPGSFLEDMGVSFKKGDEIALTGSKVKQDEADLILAREVVKGTDTLVLRDDKGKPIWNWHR